MGAVCDPRDYRYAARGFRVRRVLLMRSGNDTISLRAHAKVNLVLRVGAPVDDPGAPTHGYHPVCSYMSALELCDRVEIERAEETRYDIRWDDGRGWYDRAAANTLFDEKSAAQPWRGSR